MDRFFPAISACLVLAVLMVFGAAPLAWAGIDNDAETLLELTFPVAGSVHYTDTYTANRDDGARRHQGTDIFGVKGQPIHAAVGGVVCLAPGIDEPMPHYGYIVRICVGDTSYSYVHLNNDSPGTDDGQGGYRGAYAPGIRQGVTVARGQLIGYMGDSGNAEDTPPHLHFDIHDRSLVDPDLAAPPWRQGYRNPYPSLRAAQGRGDEASGAVRLGSRGSAVRDWQEQLKAATGATIAVDGHFGPATDAATRQFQRDHGLDADGVVGPATLAAMAALGGSARAPQVQGTPAVATGFAGRVLRLTTPPMRGDDVRAWQQKMRDRGWRGATGQPLGVDGIFGPDSDRAARLFQEEKGLGVDGVVGPATWAATFT